MEYKNIEQVIENKQKYNIIYADPPWSFLTWSPKGKGRSAERHYPCMTKEEIQKMPINQIVSDNCALLLWVTFPCLEEGIELMRAWGFKYKTCAFCWGKLNKKNNHPFMGMGYYTRANAEICLLGVKGKPLKVLSKSVRQLVLSPVQRHSQKPSIIRDRIVELFGDLPRIELFAREGAQGWDSMGNEL